MVCFDELDALGPTRTGEETDVMARLVPQLLTAIKGFRPNDAPILLLGAIEHVVEN